MDTSKCWNRCEYCGKFVSFKDIEEGKVVHKLLYPDSQFTKETYETYHKSCNPGIELKNLILLKRLTNENSIARRG